MNPSTVTSTRTLALLVGGALWAGSASAVVLPDEVLQALERQDNAFVRQAGYTPVELDAPFWDRYYKLLDAWFQKSGRRANPASVSMPDSDMGPIEKAVRVLEAEDGKLPRVRYHIEYRRVTLPELDYWEPRAHIQVTRFNLGPLLRREVVAAHGAENTASHEEFGIGPHVRWRFVIGPMQNQRSNPWAATRQVLSAAQAQAADCLDTPCLSTQPAEGPATGWKELDTPPQFALPATGEFSDAAAAAGSVAGAGLGPSNDGYGEAVEGIGATAPQLILVATDGLGSDPAVDVLAHEPAVMDDAIARLWTRRVEFVGGFGSVSWSQLPVYRPGRQ